MESPARSRRSLDRYLVPGRALPWGSSWVEFQMCGFEGGTQAQATRIPRTAPALPSAALLTAAGFNHLLVFCARFFLLFSSP